MGRPGLILVKDLKEAFGQRSMLARAFLGTAVAPIIMATLWSGAVHSDEARRFLFPFALLLLAFTGSTVAVISAATALAGEKERRTAEALLAAPVSDGELFVGKMLAAWLPGTLTGYLGQSLFLGTWWLRDPWQPSSVLSGTQWLVVVAAPPLLALIVACLGLIISSRSATVLSAIQLGALLSSPVSGACLWLGYRAMTEGPGALYLFFAVSLALSLTLGIIGARQLNREAIVMRL